MEFPKTNVAGISLKNSCAITYIYIRWVSCIQYIDSLKNGIISHFSTGLCSSLYLGMSAFISMLHQLYEFIN